MFTVDLGELDEPLAGVLLIRLRQRMECSLDDGLSTPLCRLIARRRPARVVMSCSALTRCTNEDMGELLAVQRFQQRFQQQAHMVLTELPETVRAKVEGLGLHRLLDICDTAAEALHQPANCKSAGCSKEA